MESLSRSNFSRPSSSSAVRNTWLVSLASRVACSSMSDTSSLDGYSRRLISSNPELALWIVAKGVLNAWANPSRTVDRSCSLRFAASALLSAANECALSKAIAEREAIASTDRESRQAPGEGLAMQMAPTGLVPSLNTRLYVQDIRLFSESS